MKTYKLLVFTNDELTNETTADITSLLSHVYNALVGNNNEKMRIKGNDPENYDLHFKFYNGVSNMEYVFKNVDIHHGFIDEYKTREEKLLYSELKRKEELYNKYLEALKMPYFSYHQEAAREGVIQEIKDSLIDEFIKEMKRKENKREC